MSRASRMSPRERMMTAMANGKPDRVPVAPDISNMIPARMTGKPFWDIYLHDDPPIWKAYLDAVERLGIDGWFIYGDMGYRYPGGRTEAAAEIAEVDDRKVVTWRGTTSGLPFEKEWIYYRADSPTLTRKSVKDLDRQWDLVEAFLAPPIARDPTLLREQRRLLGERGAFGVHVCYPGLQNWPYVWLDGGIEKAAEWYADRHDRILEIRDMQDRMLAVEMEMVLDERPDFVILGGSGTITLQGPVIARELCLPSIKRLTRMAKQAGVTIMLHSCGRERELVQMCYEETDLDCINPVEGPPMGDCDLAEIKRTFGHRLSFMGNLHTTEVMLFGTREKVREASRKAIEAAGANGGFILSTGDQCGRDTPDANIRAMIEAAEEFGRY
jgi:uroporphyrinogen decarboxylase